MKLLLVLCVAVVTRDTLALVPSLRPVSSRSKESKRCSSARASRDATQGQHQQGGGDHEQRASRILILGGTGRIGTAAATHLLTSSKDQPLEVLLGGRDEARGEAAVQEVTADAGGAESLRALGHSVHFSPLNFRDSDNLKALLSAEGGMDSVLHTAGPFTDNDPLVLKACIEAQVPHYVDVSDPIEFLDASLALKAQAEASGTCALLSAGAFPGLSNMLAMESSSLLLEDLGAVAERPRHRQGPEGSDTAEERTDGGVQQQQQLVIQPEVQDITFSYFTAGLGGSGVINLYITNLGYGEPVPTYRSGGYSPQLNAGLDDKYVDFFLDESDESFSRVGRRISWAWPFPEAKTVAEALRIKGDSAVRMGTAPDLWNKVLKVLVMAVPRGWWRSEAFSMGLAKFSEPLVAITDKFVGETHAMRIDVRATDGSTISTVQAHESFRLCVGQSCAEFLLELMRQSSNTSSGDSSSSSSSSRSSGSGGDSDEAEEHQAGVFLPETLYSNERRGRRAALVERMTNTPGTFTFTQKTAICRQTP